MSSEKCLKNFKVAVVQACPAMLDRPKTIEKIATLTKDAASKGAKLIAFPESFISTFPRGTTFGAKIGSRTPEGRDEFLRYFESAIEIPSPDVTRLEEIAKKNNVYLVIGVTEKEGGTLYCTVIFISPEGKYLGKHRKLMPTGAERIIWGRGDGSTLPVFDTPLGKIGAVICWENFMPLLRTTMYSKGIQLYLALTADFSDAWLTTVRHIAVEGRCFVLCANQFSRRSDYMAQDKPLEGFDSDPKTIVAGGGSCIINPMGDVIAGPNYTDECILIADINLGEVIKGKFDLDVVGNYARPDIFQLYVNEDSPSTVILSSGKEKPITVTTVGENTQVDESEEFGYVH